MITTQQIEDIATFWLYVLPNGIDKKIFETNLKKVIGNCSEKLEIN